MTLPPTLRLTILRRLSFLPAETLQALRAAAILGPGFSLTDLATVAPTASGQAERPQRRAADRHHLDTRPVRRVLAAGDRDGITKLRRRVLAWISRNSPRAARG